MNRPKKILGLLEYEKRFFLSLILLILGISLLLTLFSTQFSLAQLRKKALRNQEFFRLGVQDFLQTRKNALDSFKALESDLYYAPLFCQDFFSFIAESDSQGCIERVFVGPDLSGLTLKKGLLDGGWHASSVFFDDGSLGFFTASPWKDGYVVGAVSIKEGFLESFGSKNPETWGALVGAQGMVLRAWNDDNLFPPGSLIPKKFFSFANYHKESIVDRSVEIVATELFSELYYVTGIWVGQVYGGIFRLAGGLGVAFFLVFSGFACLFRRFIRKTYQDFTELAQVLEHLENSIEKTTRPVDAVLEIRYRYARVLSEEFGNFKESKSLVKAFSGMIDSVASQGQELVAHYEEALALQDELTHANKELRQTLEYLEELAHFSQTIVEAKDTKEASRALIRNMIAFSDAEAGGVVLMEENRPNLLVFIGAPKARRELEILCERHLSEGTVDFFITGEDIWHAFPITYLGDLLGTVFLAKALDRKEGISIRVQNAMAHFIPHVGGILRSRALVEEVHRSFHYMAARLQVASSSYHDETGDHLARIRTYTLFIGEKLGIRGEALEDLGTYSMLHDIGKLKIPLRILAKAGDLTPDEFEIVKKHTLYGTEILGDSDWLEVAREIALCHHEKWDGSGYPQGLKGEDIPLSARIVALADVYDALRAERAYKPSFSHQKVQGIILQGDGRVMPEHFDPVILEIFRQHHDYFNRIYEKSSSDLEKSLFNM